MENSRLHKTEKWVFYFMCGFALFSSISIAVGNIFLSLSLAGLLYRCYLRHDDLLERLCPDRKVMLVLAAVIAAAALSAAFSGDILWGLRVFGDHYFYRMTGLFAVLIAVKDKKRLWILVELALASLLINNLHCLWEAWVRPDHRAGGFLGFYMPTAGALSIETTLLLIFGISAKRLRDRCLCWGMFLIAVLALLYTETRGAWIAVAVAAVLSSALLAQSKKKCLLACLAALLLLIGGVSMSHSLQMRMVSITDRDFQSNSERILIWTSAWHMFQDHPLLGVGVGQYERAYQTEYIMPAAKERQLGHAHSNVMQMFAERGALGGIAFLAMWGYLTWFSVRGWQKRRELAYLALFAMVTGMMIQGLTEYNMGNSVVAKLFWFSIAVALQWIRMTREEVKE